MDQYYRPDNMVLGIWGEIDFAKAVEMIEHLYSEQRVVAGDPFKVPTVKPTTTPEMCIRDRCAPDGDREGAKQAT